ncbi:MAG: hypothetical protein VXA43_07985, partial [Candidatus Poseidoniales archaeon]
MNFNIVTNITQQVCQTDVEDIREVYLEAICVLAEASTSFILKLDGGKAKVVRSTLPSLLNVSLKSDSIRLEDDSFCLTEDELAAWSALP